jgi:hypothetical protein
MKLKSLSIILGEQMIRLNNTKQDEDKIIPQPIDYDPVTERCIQRLPDGKVQVLKLDKVLFYQYEEEKPILQS